MKTEKLNNGNAFQDLVKAYNADPTDERVLIDLATATARSVLKKVIDPTRKGNGETVSDSGQSPALLKIRSEMSADLAYMETLSNAVNRATHWSYNDNGDPVNVVDDPDADRAVSQMIKMTLGDGLDLVNDAVVAILDETAKQADRNDGDGVDLERPYTVRRLKRRVWIKTAESVNGWETVETTPIQEVFKAVRRAIDASRAMQTDPRNGYTYLADVASDPESDAESVIYRRFAKYADMGGRVCDFNGKETAPTTADAETVKDLDRIVESMNLTDRESEILRFRLRGYSVKAAATAMGVSVNTYKGALNRMRAKAAAVGLTVK